MNIRSSKGGAPFRKLHNATRHKPSLQASALAQSQEALAVSCTPIETLGSDPAYANKTPFLRLEVGWLIEGLPNGKKDKALTCPLTSHHGSVH